MAAGGDDPRLGDGLPRRIDRGARAARDERGPGCGRGGRAVDRQRVHADAGRADPGGWITRRPAGTSPCLRDRGRGLRAGVRDVRARPDDRGARRGQGPARCRCSAADAGEPGDHLGVVRARRSGTGDRHLVGARRGDDGDRAVGRRLARRDDRLARHLLDQHPAGDRRGVDRGQARAGDIGRSGPDRLRGSGVDRCRARGAHLRPGGEVLALVRRRAGPAGGVRDPSEADSARAGAAVVVRRPGVHGGQHLHLRDLRCARGVELPARPAAAVRVRILARWWRVWPVSR